jgi:hypothetical protein
VLGHAPPVSGLDFLFGGKSCTLRSAKSLIRHAQALAHFLGRVSWCSVPTLFSMCPSIGLSPWLILLLTSTALQFSLPSVLDLAASVLVPSPVWFPIQISVRHFTIGLSFQLKSGFCHRFLLGCDLVSSADLARTVIRAWMLLFCALRCSISVLFDSPLTVVLDLVRFLAG